VESREGVAETSQSTLRQYLEEVAAIPLLTREEENALARRARKGDREAMQRLVESSLRFVISVAKKYQGRGLDLIDLINTGNLGLVLAAKRFEPERDVRFISYAVWWVKQAIRQGIAQQHGAVRVPAVKVKTYCQIRDVYEGLAHRLGREPSMTELADETGMTFEEVEECLAQAEEAISLDSPVGEDGSVTLADYLTEGEVISAEERVIRESLFNDLLSMMESLTPREQKVLRLRYGLDGGQPQTLEEIGCMLRLTKERIRQIEKRAKEKLAELVEKRQIMEGVN